jgi:hypothetical protein
MQPLRCTERKYVEANYDQFTGSEFGYEFVFIPTRVGTESVQRWCSDFERVFR